MLELPFPSYLAITTSYCVPSSDEESCVWSTKGTAFQDNDLFLPITTSFINFEIMKFTTSNTSSFSLCCIWKQCWRASNKTKEMIHGSTGCHLPFPLCRYDSISQVSSCKVSQVTHDTERDEMLTLFKWLHSDHRILVLYSTWIYS